METINYNGTTICILDDSDMLTDFPLGSYAVIGESDAPAIHVNPVQSLRSANVKSIDGKFSL